MNFTPAQYDNWYHTPRGRRIGETEFALMWQLLQPAPGTRLLDIGCGTGHFSRRFADAGLQVTGLDPDPAMLDYARQQGGAIDYVHGDGRDLPFADGQFDYCAAVTSLCFIDTPAAALAQMWRVCRRGVVLGLLNRHSLLYRQKRGRGSYRGARWDTWREVREWLAMLNPPPQRVRHGSGVFLPAGHALARLCERLLPRQLPWGGFLAVSLDRHTTAEDQHVPHNDIKQPKD